MDLSNGLDALLEYQDKVCIGIYDFSYAPYALGDAITWQVNLCVNALMNGTNKKVICIVADPAIPSCYHQETTITASNYIQHLHDLLPAFLCCPDTLSMHLLNSISKFNLFLLTKIYPDRLTWPTVKDHLMRKWVFTSHSDLNDFYSRNNYIPRLGPPKGYESSVNHLLGTRCKERFVVSVNIRQRKFYTNIHEERFFDSRANITRRDSPLKEWYNFFRIAKDKYPEAVFLILGGYSTWERELYHYENVLIPRTMGFGLAHELTLLHKSDLFFGTSSGFSAAATFSTVPYIITNFDHAASAYIGLPVGTPKYPFALPNQTLNWETESTGLLLHLFDNMYKALKKGR